jgi:putative DNA (cytosine-5-)-methyltransferase
LAGRKVSAKRYAFINTMKKTTVVKNFRMLETARKLRREMTPQETKLWYRFLRSYPVKIYKQRIIESFIVDFYCADARLVIEIDGSQHYTEQGKCYDEERSQILRAYGLKVLRFSNRDVDRSFDSVCAQIQNIIQERCALPADDDD